MSPPHVSPRISHHKKWQLGRYRLLTCRLALGVQGVNVHGEVQLVANDLLVLSSELVGTVDALGVPVCPVQAVFKHGNCKRVWEAWGPSRETSVQMWPAWAQAWQ